MLICHPHHPLAKSKSVRLKALNGQKFISFEPDIPTRKALDKILKEHSVHVQHVMEFDNIETVKRAVEIDAGRCHRARREPSSRKSPSRRWPR